VDIFFLGEITFSGTSLLIITLLLWEKSVWNYSVSTNAAGPQNQLQGDFRE